MAKAPIILVATALISVVTIAPLIGLPASLTMAPATVGVSGFGVRTVVGVLDKRLIVTPIINRTISPIIPRMIHLRRGRFLICSDASSVTCEIISVEGGFSLFSDINSNVPWLHGMAETFFGLVAYGG